MEQQERGRSPFERTGNSFGGSFTQDNKNRSFYTTQSPINTSTSKHMFSFSKADRFLNSTSINPHISYDIKGTIRTQKSSGVGTAFGSVNRFNYYQTPEKNGNDPSPMHYQSKESFSPTNKTNAFSFGVSRENMKKIHLQVIEKLAQEPLPGPGRYSLPRTFGNEGSHYSLRANTYQQELALEKANKLPGPGSYTQPDLVGHTNSPRMTSIIKSPQAASFPKAKDRFIMPTFKERAPGPGIYNPLNGLNQNYSSLHRSFGGPKFSKDERKALEDQKLKYKHNPGPGNYTIIGDFGTYQTPELQIGRRRKTDQIS